MRFLIVLILIVLSVAGLGFYRGWFHVTSNNSTVNLTVDKDKIEQDKQDAQKKVHGVKQE
jgi:hypothetical protein